MGNCEYPAVLDLSGRRCLIVGGGEVAERKLAGVLERGGAAATVEVISPAVSPRIRRRADEGGIVVTLRRFRPSDLEGAFLVFAATDDREVNARIAERCRELGILVNVADTPERCSFQVPAVATAGLLQLGVSTGGAAPALAAEIARELAEQYRGIGEYIEMLSRFRLQLRLDGGDAARGAVLLREAAAPELIEAARAGRHDVVRDRLEQLIKIAREEL